MPGELAEIHRASAEVVELLHSSSVVGGNPSAGIFGMWMISEGSVRASEESWMIFRPRATSYPTLFEGSHGFRLVT